LITAIATTKRRSKHSTRWVPPIEAAAASRHGWEEATPPAASPAPTPFAAHTTAQTAAHATHAIWIEEGRDQIVPRAGRHGARRKESPGAGGQTATAKWQTATAVWPAAAAKGVRTEGRWQPSARDAIKVATEDARDHATAVRHSTEVHAVTAAWPWPHWHAARREACCCRSLACCTLGALCLSCSAQFLLVAAAKSSGGACSGGRGSGSGAGGRVRVARPGWWIAKARLVEPVPEEVVESEAAQLGARATCLHQVPKVRHVHENSELELRAQVEQSRTR
jgi:hypothetical protein